MQTLEDTITYEQRRQEMAPHMVTTGNGDMVRCECGEYTGERCTWIGSKDDTVIVEFMPYYLRASHKAAGNAGVYPYNGAVRVRCAKECAESIVESDADWASIVE